MTKSDKKEFVFQKLSQLLIPQGYYLVKTGLDPRFVLKEKEKVIFFILNFNDSGSIVMSKTMISILIVEEIMIEIKKPNQDYSFLDDKKYFLDTLLDKNTSIEGKYDNGSINHNVNDKEQLDYFTKSIITYIETEGQKFIEKYSYLPNVLAEMDKLQLEGKYWNELLSGGPEFLFRGLIISKLCNDKKYEEKLSYVESLLISMADDFLPYFEKLKIRLDDLKPKYNLKE